MQVLQVAGHEPVAALLKRLKAQSLLFTGPERVGRRRMARWYAAWLNCLTEGQEPCGACGSCLAFGAESHPDYREVGPKTTTGSGRVSRRPELRIDQLVPREGGDGEPLSRWLEQRPRFSTRVAVIDQADTLTPGAANAFLKVLEEPPSYARIILIAPSPEAVLPTIASRATVLRFGTIPTGRLDTGMPGHPLARLGQAGELIEAAQRPQEFESLLATVDDYLRALPKGLELSLEHADGLEKAWLAAENFDLPLLLRARLSDFPPGAYAGGVDALARCEAALAAYASPSVALQVLTLELRKLLRANPG